MAKKPKPNFDDLDKVMRELVLPFYGVERSVPLPLPNGQRNENDAEHSWSVALVACMLAPYVDPALDVGKICQFATVHDLAEVYAGDTSNFAPAEELHTKEEREHESLQKIAQDFAHFPWLIDTLEAYERQDTEEARFVRSVDKIIPLLFDYLTEGLYYHENRHTMEDFIAFMRRPTEKAKIHPGAYAYHEEVMAVLLSTPKLFHPAGKSKQPKSKKK